MGVYRVEIAPSNRAGCVNTECKKEGIKIPKGMLRFGVLVTIQERQTWKWKHWGCVTPKQIASVKEAIEDDVDQFDGYEELPKDLQDKIKAALVDGHIADDDWNGDVEMNRTGKNGFRTPASKKQKKEETKKEAEAAEEAENATPSKPPSNKRGHAKDEPNSEDGEDEEPAPKKRKAAPKKQKKNAEENIGAADTEHKPAKKGRRNGEKPKEETEPTIGVKDESSDHDVVPLPPAKKERKNAKKSRKEPKSPIGVKHELSDGDLVPSPAAKKIKAPRRSTATKKVKDEEVDGDATADAPKPAATAPTKKRAPRKTAAAKKARETKQDHETEDIVEPTAEPAEGSNEVKADQILGHRREKEDDANEIFPKNKKGGIRGVKKVAKKAKPESK